MVVAITLGCVILLESASDFIHRWNSGSTRTSDYDARAKRSEAILTTQEESVRKSREYLEHIAEDEKRTRTLLDKQEQTYARFQQVITTWERQQKEYQAYLDSLKKPQ